MFQGKNVLCLSKSTKTEREISRLFFVNRIAKLVAAVVFKLFESFSTFCGDRPFPITTGAQLSKGLTVMLSITFSYTILAYSS